MGASPGVDFRPHPDQQFEAMFIGADGAAFPAATPLAGIPAFLPSGPWNGETVIAINGVGCTVDQQVPDLRAIAEQTGSRVIGFHNATQGLPGDVAQAVLDWLGSSRNLATKTLATHLHRELAAGHPVHLLAHSQGSAIARAALRLATGQLLAERGPVETRRTLGALVKVETFASPVGGWPEGPTYRHYVNLRDPVPWFWTRKEPGVNGRLVFFRDRDAPHQVTTYLRHWKPFDAPGLQPRGWHDDTRFGD